MSIINQMLGGGGGKENYATGKVSPIASLYSESSISRYVVTGLTFKPRIVILIRPDSQMTASYVIFLTDQNYSPSLEVLVKTSQNYATTIIFPDGLGDISSYASVWRVDYFVTDTGFSAHGVDNEEMYFYCC